MSHPIAHRLLSSVAAATLVVTGLFATSAQPVSADGGSDFTSMVNNYRSGQGLGPVALHAAIDRIATERARQISEDGGWNHDFDYIKQRFDELGICWRGFGEIIAVNGSGDVSRFGEQWWGSPTHHDIMLGDYTHVGGSRYQADDGWYAAMVFVKLCGASTSPGGSFTDTGSSQFRADIGWLVAEGVTAGCSADRFCPRSAVTREQMASFLRRITGVPASTSGWFTDIRTSMHRADINGVAKADIAAGCDDARYCPSTQVTREQMASFLVRALNLPPTTRDYFRDDEGSMHESAVNRLAASGITGGCSSGRFCPTDPVTREQMAGFLHRAFGD